MTKAAKKTNRQVERRILDSLTVYGRNARTHSDEQVRRIKASLREFGWTNPVLMDEKSNIIARHGRLTASRELRPGKVQCIDLSYSNDEQKGVYIVADSGKRQIVTDLKSP